MSKTELAKNLCSRTLHLSEMGRNRNQPVKFGDESGSIQEKIREFGSEPIGFAVQVKHPFREKR